ncbi:hypothetical protein [Rhodopirellula sallentina]|nr:hypothetical protein [Rhodopirellula sallentina]
MTSLHHPTFDNLLRLHEVATERFPHDYLDVGLNAIGLFFHDPPKNAGYPQTPIHSVTFASIGVDGIHFSSVTDGKTVDPDAPVVLTIPMAFNDPNHIVGENLHDFLCLGCRIGYAELGNLHLDRTATLDRYANNPIDYYDNRSPGILTLLASEFALTPWTNVPQHFADLQSRFKQTLRTVERLPRQFGR